MHKIEFCCPIWVDLAQYGTSIYHSGVSTWQNYKKHLENEMKIPNSLCVWKFIKSGKFPGITTLFLKLAEDDNLTGLQTNTKKAFHILISKRTTKHCGTICCSKYHNWASCFYFLFKCWKVLNFLCFFSTQIDHLNGLQTIVKLWTYDLSVWQSGNLAIWQSGNLAIWQSGSILAATMQQSGSNLAIWEWQSCITAT